MNKLWKAITTVTSLRHRALNARPDDISYIGIVAPAAYPFTKETKDNKRSTEGIDFMHKAFQKLLSQPQDEASWVHYVDGFGQQAELSVIYSTTPQHRERDKQLLSQESGDNLTFYDPGDPLVELHRLLTSGDDEATPTEEAAL